MTDLPPGEWSEVESGWTWDRTAHASVSFRMDPPSALTPEQHDAARAAAYKLLLPAMHDFLASESTSPSADGGIFYPGAATGTRGAAWGGIGFTLGCYPVGWVPATDEEREAYIAQVLAEEDAAEAERAQA